MKNLKSVYFTALASLAISFILGCAEKPKKGETVEAADNAAKREQETEHKEINSTVANGIADAQKSIDQSQKNLKAELEKRKSELISRFESSNQELVSRIASLKTQYEELSASLPKDVAEQLDEKVILIVSSLQSLQNLVKDFSPNSIEQIADFKSEYEKEFAKAKDLVDQALKLLESKDISPPKLL